MNENFEIYQDQETYQSFNNLFNIWTTINKISNDNEIILKMKNSIDKVNKMLLENLKKIKGKFFYKNYLNFR